MLRYVIAAVDANESFLQALAQVLPEDEIMTLGQRLEQKGFEKGKLEGILEGQHTEALKIARNMLLQGFAHKLIQQVTQLSDEDILKIKLYH